MSKRRVALVAVGVLAASGLLAMTDTIGSAGGATTDTVYTRTFYGPDFKSLDFRISPQFLPNTGGGVYGQQPSSVQWSGDYYFEAPVDLPVGANVTSVSFYYADCGPGSIELADYYFGSYKPSVGQFAYALPASVGGHSGACGVRYTFTRSKPTIATVLPDRRYVLGAHAYLHVLGDTPTTDPDWTIFGARVRYTCPSLCT